jgi:hypothetical protein
MLVMRPCHIWDQRNEKGAVGGSRCELACHVPVDP